MTPSTLFSILLLILPSKNPHTNRYVFHPSTQRLILKTLITGLSFKYEYFGSTQGASSRAQALQAILSANPQPITDPETLRANIDQMAAVSPAPYDVVMARVNLSYAQSFHAIQKD